MVERARGGVLYVAAEADLTDEVIRAYDQDVQCKGGEEVGATADPPHSRRRCPGRARPRGRHRRLLGDRRRGDHRGRRRAIGHHVVLEGRVVIGPRARIGHGSALGGIPQDLKFKPGTPSGVRVGAGTTIREYVTIHRATTPRGMDGSRRGVPAHDHVSRGPRLPSRSRGYPHQLRGAHRAR